jgi:hypothetical protein
LASGSAADRALRTVISVRVETTLGHADVRVVGEHVRRACSGPAAVMVLGCGDDAIGGALALVAFVGWLPGDAERDDEVLVELEPDLVARVGLDAGDPCRVVGGPGQRCGEPVVIAGEPAQVLGQGPFEVAQLVGEVGEMVEGVGGSAGVQLPCGEDLGRLGVAW